MENIELLLRLNLEIDGALRTYSARMTSESEQLLKDKFTAFSEAFNNMFCQVGSETSDDKQCAETDGIEDKSGPLTLNPETYLPASDESISTGMEDKADTHEIADTQVILDEECLIDLDNIVSGASDINATYSEGKADRVYGDEEKSKSEPIVMNDILSFREAKDLTKAFTLNDKFRFLRGLFCGKKEDFDNTLQKLSKMESLDEAYDYLLNDLEWDVDNEDVQAFICIISNHFNEA